MVSPTRRPRGERERPSTAYKKTRKNTAVRGCRKGADGAKAPLGFCNHQQKNVVFLVSSRKKQISPLLAPPRKFLEKPPSAPLEKNLPTPMLWFMQQRATENLNDAV